MPHLGIIALVLHTPLIIALDYDRFTENVHYLNTHEIVEGLQHALNEDVLSSKCADDLRQLRAVANGTWKSDDVSIWTEAKRQDLLHSYTSGPYAPFG